MVAVLREWQGRTLRFVVGSADIGVPVFACQIATGSMAYADKAAVRDELYARFVVKRINHSVAFSDYGACTNQAESYFSRLCRGRIRPASPHQRGLRGRDGVARGMRREDNGTQYDRLTADALHHPGQ